MESIIKMFDWVGNNNDMAVLFFVFIFGGILLIYWHADKRTDFDLRDLMIDVKTGKLAVLKVGQLASLMVSTWVLIHETRAGKLSEWLFSAYMLVWSGSDLVKRYIDKDSPPVTPPDPTNK